MSEWYCPKCKEKVDLEGTGARWLIQTHECVEVEA